MPQCGTQPKLLFQGATLTNPYSTPEATCTRKVTNSAYCGGVSKSGHVFEDTRI